MNKLSFVSRAEQIMLVFAMMLFLSLPLSKAYAEDPAPAEGTELTTDEAADGTEMSGDEAMMGEEDAPMTDVIEESVANPYGLSALWNEGDIISKATLFILGFMSMGSWYILITKLGEQRSVFSHANTVGQKFAPANSVKEGIAALPESNSFRVIAEDGFEASEESRKGVSAHASLMEWTSHSLDRSVDRFASRLQGGLAFLATVGSTAPFVGLFGTVWGIYHALVAIGVSGQASIDKVAGPVGEALIMTAIGLAVAVPAVLGYNLLVRRNKALVNISRRFAADVQTRILMGQAG